MKKAYLLHISFLFFFLLLGFSSAMAQAEFITRWKTTANGESITIPTEYGLTYNYTVDWGDGSPTTTHNATNLGSDTMPADATHTYAIAGTYTVTISGTFPAIYLYGKSKKDKIISIEQWGTGTWQTMEGAFSGCSNLEGNFTDVPRLAPGASLAYMFASCSKFNHPIGNWDVSEVTNMRAMFENATAFNQPLNNWNVSKVTDMYAMFSGATTFDQPLNNWDVSNVTNMRAMFENATAFNQPLNNWNVSKVTDMSYMFCVAEAFNQPLNNWNVSKVTNVEGMFLFAFAFNQPLNNWDVSKVTDMWRMFDNATAFNQPLNNWDVSKVTNMGEMFYSASAFDQNIGDWDVSQVTNMEGMFDNATLSTANYDALLIGWNTRALKPNLKFHGGNSKYCTGATARTNMLSSTTTGHKWKSITDNGNVDTYPQALSYAPANVFMAGKVDADIYDVAAQIKDGIVLSPNPVLPGATFVLEANYPAAELEGAKVQIISVGSQFTEMKSIEQVGTTLNAPPVSGLYIVRLLLRNGKQASGNLSVR